MTVRLGLIGPGKWGKNYIEVAKEAGAEVVWAYGRNWREQPKAKIDGLIVAIPPDERTGFLCDIAGGGPMMVEKPLCLSSFDAKLIYATLRPGVPFLVNYQHLFSARYLEIRDRVNGATNLQCRAVASGPEVRSYSQLWDYGPHFLAMAAGCGVPLEDVQIELSVDDRKQFEWRLDEVDAFSTTRHFYYSREHRPLVDAVQAFVRSVEDGGTDDWRFGVEMSLAITKELERRSTEGLKNAAG